MATNIGVGDILGGFQIEKELGRGGMGVVYKGHELSLNRKVALKVLSERLCLDEEFIKRFKREAQAIAAMNHPNIVSILSYGESDGLYYFAMEYVQGKDLGQILKEEGLLPLEKVLSIGAQVAGALAEAGSRGVVHRDLKPSNIMLDYHGRAKVTDFGVAYYCEGNMQRLTQAGLFLGSPEYCSPEQAAGKSLDIRSDIYALGAVLYRMLSGKPPIIGDSPLAVITKIATTEVVPISQINRALPRNVCDLIGKMMAKLLPDRFQSPEEVLAAIENCIEIKASPVAQKFFPVSSPREKIFGTALIICVAILLWSTLKEKNNENIGSTNIAVASVESESNDEPEPEIKPMIEIKRSKVSKPKASKKQLEAPEIKKEEEKTSDLAEASELKIEI